MPAVITYPAGEGPFPMVVMVHGSGPLDRDETIGPNHPFRDIALGLARRGVASLRYDKRTYAYPASAKAISIYDETIDDALTALRMAFADPKADTARIVLLGHSLGARSHRSSPRARLLSAAWWSWRERPAPWQKWWANSCAISVRRGRRMLTSTRSQGVSRQPRPSISQD